MHPEIDTSFLKLLYRIYFRIKKILKVDYRRGRAKGYYANFFSVKSLKIEFSLFHPSGSHLADISSRKGRISGTPRQSLVEFFRLKIIQHIVININF